MMGLLKSDFRKLMRTKSLWVCCVIAVALGVAMAFLYHYFWEERGRSIAMTYALMQRFGMKTDSLDTAMASMPKNNLWAFINVFLSDSSIWLLGAICLCAFASSEFSMGTFKNTIARGVSRGKIYVSKFLAAFAEIMIVAVVYTAAGGITAWFLVEHSTDFSAGEMALMVGTYVLLLAATASLYLMLSVVFRKTGLAVAVAIVAPTLVMTLVNLIGMTKPDLSEQLSLYVLMETYLLVQPNVQSGEWYLCPLIALGYAILSYVIGCLAFRFAEIK